MEGFKNENKVQTFEDGIKIQDDKNIRILKFVANDFKIDISFFMKLYNDKINIYKLNTNYINLHSTTFIKKIKKKHDIKYYYNIIDLDYPYVHISATEINDRCFLEDDLKEFAINRYSNKHFGLLLNFNTKENYLHCKRETHIEHILKNFQNYLNKKKDNTCQNIYDDSFWIYEENELNFNERINKYLILSYFDLKGCIYYYCIANPVIVPEKDFELKKKINRIYYYMDYKNVYINNDKGKINIIDLLYLSSNFENFFDNYKRYIKTNVFLLLKLNKDSFFNLNNNNHNKIKNFVSKNVNENTNEEYLNNNVNINNIFNEENIYMDTYTFYKKNKKIDKIYKLNSFKDVFEFINNADEEEQNSFLNKHNGNIILPLNALSELNNDLKELKDKKLKNIKKKFFKLYICFIDFSCMFHCLNWNYRNVLYCLSLKYELFDFQLDVLVFRDLSLMTDDIICTTKNDNFIWKYPLINTLKNVNNLMNTINKSDDKHYENSFNYIEYTRGISYKKIESCEQIKKRINKSDNIIKMSLNSAIFKIKIPKKEEFLYKEEEVIENSINFNENKLNENKLNKNKLNENKLNENELNENKLNENKLNENKLNKNELNENKLNENKLNENKLNENNKNKKKQKSYKVNQGWKMYEKKQSNNIKQKTIYYRVDLNSFINKNAIQRLSLELNIKLIKWKILKELKYENFMNLKILIIGLGTLGCMVVRNLISWGIKNFTFIDNSRVSYSNLSRQYLYTFDNASYNDNIGEYKSVAAKNNLLKIIPDLNITSKVMDIPMPGHSNYLKKDFYKTIKELDVLIDNHHVVFLLTDSRESRYFPCLLIAEKRYDSLLKIEENMKLNSNKNFMNKINYGNDLFYNDIKNFEDNLIKKKYNKFSVYNRIFNSVEQLKRLPPLGITVAIGFDSCLILRHPYLFFKSSCFYCNDIYSPYDSITNRTIDQKCTVTRSGISNISSSIAVELLLSLTQHPLYFFAPHIVEDQYFFCNNMNFDKKMNNNSTESCLGATPHIIKFNLSDFSSVKFYSDPSENCFCCSENIILKYKENKYEFIKNVIKDSSILEEYTNIKNFKNSKENVILID